MRSLLLAPVALFLSLSLVASAADKKSPTYLSAEEAGIDFQIQGEYEGMAGDTKMGAQVIARGKGKFEVHVLGGGLPGAGWTLKDEIVLDGTLTDGVVNLKGKMAEGKIEGDTLSIAVLEGDSFSLTKTVRQSPTLGAKAPEFATVLFDGTDLEAWNGGEIVDGHLGTLGKDGAPRTKRSFENFTLHLEFRTPFMPEALGQARGNSGMYLTDQYETQVLDSFGLPGYDNECGGIYKISRPILNMCLPPLSWQTYDVDFQGAKFDDEGKKVEDGVVTIKLNGVKIHDNLKLPHATPGGGRSDEKAGPLFLQNHGNPVHFRNIWIVEKD
ncbi:hypothetical protein Pla110_02110 [Polystyrenella longa]|uniref:3-keto-alpha-glucoside-1,2-lyase/3-keto-2-hydroxy-glucal hydratase domain-containing protein n=1 Tax=Polystyrenella longa TaxID=2528007 RepID=A0A518CH06_9PLAN|nr:DUF1080 domain-containing protein [Polystyrenella longa]QDU78507.1 hypothetical protein Pla110_02110 [Polystyrenella longa]